MKVMSIAGDRSATRDAKTQSILPPCHIRVDQLGTPPAARRLPGNVLDTPTVTMYM